MITTQQTVVRSFSFLTLAFMSSLLLFTNCRGDEDVYSKPEVALSSTEDIRVDATVQSKTIQINTNRTWKIEKENMYNWIDIIPMQGEAGKSTITVTVKSNDEDAPREGYFTIKSSVLEYPISVIQADKEGNTIEYVTIEKLRQMYKDSNESVLTLSGEYRLKAVVISDRKANNISYKNGYLQDETAGIAFRVTDRSHSYNLGQLLNINLRGATLSKYADALQLGFSVSNGLVKETGTLPEPKELTIEEVESGNYEGSLVKIKDVQFKDYKNKTYQQGQYPTNRILENCAEETMIVRTSSYAKFKQKLLPAGKGNLIGILSWYKKDNNSTGVWQLYLRNLDDAEEMSNDPSTRCD